MVWLDFWRDFALQFRVSELFWHADWVACPKTAPGPSLYLGWLGAREPAPTQNNSVARSVSMSAVAFVAPSTAQLEAPNHGVRLSKSVFFGSTQGFGMLCTKVVWGWFHLTPPRFIEVVVRSARHYFL